VTGLRRTPGGWTVEAVAEGRPVREEAAAVVIALPADALAALPIEGVDPALPAVLREIDHPPVASVFLGFRRGDVAHPLDGFGVLVPEVEHGRILGCLFSSTLFPGRAPEGHVAITCFVGGTRQPDLGRLPAEELVRLAREELGRLVGARGDPVVSRVRAWPRAIPQYALGYQRFQDAVTAIERAAPGVHVGGNCRDGISLANCIAGGRRLAIAAAG
jgi:oxygen-dependent protoporphyrinogen oxidase